MGDLVDFKKAKQEFSKRIKINQELYDDPFGVKKRQEESIMKNLMNGHIARKANIEQKNQSIERDN